MKSKLLPEEYLCTMAEAIKLLGHPQRLRILEYLDLNGESTVTAIVENLKAPQGAISQQLNRMRRAGLVSAQRRGRQVLYKISAINPVTILNCLRRQYNIDQGEDK
ncbi:MAG: winged helix-turn-helix transcriptional regulator [Lentisphaerae bacterium]|mgnify:CR=1 FL=1|jgi:DNA-binding transcriptional ArsR family regulator|nr:winged helix-turn-helix transcriptional regulator [Lentisphaerota bacterium]